MVLEEHAYKLQLHVYNCKQSSCGLLITTSASHLRLSDENVGKTLTSRMYSSVAMAEVQAKVQSRR